MSGYMYVPYRPNDTAMASAVSVPWIRRDLPQMCFEQVAPVQWKDCTHPEYLLFQGFLYFSPA